MPISRNSDSGPGSASNRKPVHVHDLRSAEGDEFPAMAQALAREHGAAHHLERAAACARTRASAPSCSAALRCIRSATSRSNLLQTFADQAVIAIEQCRGCSRRCRRRRAISAKSLQQQTATADVLKVISRSSVDLETVLDTLVETVARLCRADQAMMFRRRDDKYHLVAARGLSAEAKEFVLTHPVDGRPRHDERPGGVGASTRSTSPMSCRTRNTPIREGQKIAGYRTMLGIPLLREETLDRHIFD